MSTCTFHRRMQIEFQTVIWKIWCRDNNRGYAKTAREFKDELAAHLGITAKDLTIRRKEEMIYREYTLTPETLATYIHRPSYASLEEEFLSEQSPDN